MAELLFPLQFKRQYSGSIDPDMVFTTSAARVSYLTDPLRYAGQIVSCLQTSAVYVLNGSMNAWTAIGSGTGSTAIGSLTGAYGDAIGGGIAYGTSGGGLQTSQDLLMYDTPMFGDYNTKWIQIEGGQGSGIITMYKTSASVYGGYIDNSVYPDGAKMTIVDDTLNEAYIKFTSASDNIEINRSVNLEVGSYNISGVPHNHNGTYIATASSGLFATSGHTHSLSALNGTLPLSMLATSGNLGATNVLHGDGTWSPTTGGVTTGNLSAIPSSVITISNGTNAVVGTGTGITISQSTSSTHGYLTSGDWNTFNSKAVSEFSHGSTGVVSFGGLTIDTTTFGFGIIKAYFVDNTNPIIPIVTYKEFPATSGIGCSGLTTSITTFVAIDVNGVIHQKAIPFTQTEMRDWIPLGNIVHSNKSTINAVNNAPNIVLAPVNQLDDLMTAIGVFNIDGNIFTANSNNLYINKSEGNIFKSGSNFSNDTKDPHTLTLPGLTAPANIRYRTQTGVETANTQSIIPDVYDVGGTTATVAGNSWSIQRIYIFPSNLVRIQYGQALYSNKAAALAAINTEQFVTEPAIVNNGLLRGLLILDKSCTDLSDTSKALFIEVGKFGSTAGISSISTATIQSAYNNSVTPEMETNATLGAFSIKIGQDQTDIAKAFEVINTSGISTFTINGNGNVSATDVTIPTMTMGVSALSDVKSAIQMLDKVNIDQMTPSGFPSRSTTDFAYTSATRTVTVNATSGSYEFYNRGKYFVKSQTLSAAHTSAFGQYFFYYDGSGNFVCNPVNTSWSFEEAQFTMCYHNPTPATSAWRGPETIFMEERHGISMDAETHGEFHRTQGTYVVGAGFALNGITTATGIGGIVDVSYGIDSGTIRDEDIPSTLDTLNKTSGTTDIYPVFYKIGAANEWRWYVNNIPMLVNSATSNAYYNLNTGGTWSLQDITTTNRYYNIYVFAVPFSKASTSYNYRYIWVMGQALYTSTAAAQAESVLSLNTDGFPFVEIAPLWQVTMRYNNTAYTGVGLLTGKARIEAVKKIIGTSLSITLTGTVTTHNNLAGRSDPDTHPASSITFTAGGNLSAVNVQDAINELDLEKEPTVIKGNLTEATSNVLTIAGGTGAVIGSGTTIQIKAATSTVNGYLTSANWTTFNGKLAVTGAVINWLSKFSATTAVTKSIVFDNGVSVGIGANTSAFNATSPEKLKVDAGVTTSVNAALFTGSINSYFQTNIKNISSGESASSDVVMTNNLGNETSGYVDLGINSSNYSDPLFNIGGAGDSYLYASNNNIAIGTGGSNIILHVGGTTSGTEVARFTNTSAAFKYNVDTLGIYSVRGTQISTLNLGDVSAVSPTHGQTLTYSSALSKYVPATPSATGTVGNLTEATSNVLTITGGTGAVVGSGTTIQIKAATASAGGYLTSGDWTTFNGKVSSATLASYALSGHSHYTSGLTDVSAVAPLNGQTLVYSSATSKYTPSKGTSIDFNEYTEVLMPGLNWTSTATPATTSAGTFYGMAYGNGVFIIPNYGYSNYLYSNDGVSWIEKQYGVANTVVDGILYANGMFLTLEYNSYNYLTSIDGITWTQRTYPYNYIGGMTYGKGKFVGVNGNLTTSAAIYSTDGVSWTNTSLPELGNWIAPCYGNGLFVAVAYAGTGQRLATSTDGVTWTSATNPLSAAAMRSVCYGNGKFVAVAETGVTYRLMTSTDAVTWTASTALPLLAWMHIIYANGLFVALAKTALYTSPDGITWTQRTIPSTSTTWRGVGYGNGLFAITSDDRKLAYSGRALITTNNSDQYTNNIQTFNNGFNVPGSLNGQALVYSSATSTYVPTTLATTTLTEFADVLAPGVTWKSASTAAAAAVMYSVAYGGGKFVGVDNTNGSNLISYDGINWTSASMAGASGANNAKAITYGNGRWVATFDQAIITHSIDGINWTSAVAPSVNGNAICYGNGQFVVMCYNTNNVMTSPNGINWTLRSAALSESGGWVAVCYGNGAYVAVANGGGSNRLVRSVDGINWTTPPNPTSANTVSGVVYGNGLFVVTSYAGTGKFATSPDGITWTERTVPLNTLAWRQVTYGNGIFVVVGSLGTLTRVMTSLDGITWTPRTTPVDNTWLNICYGDGIFVAAAINGTNNRIMYSGVKRSITNNSDQYTNNTQTFNNGIVVGTGTPTSSNMSILAIGRSTASPTIQVKCPSGATNTLATVRVDNDAGTGYIAMVARGTAVAGDSFGMSRTGSPEITGGGGVFILGTDDANPVVLGVNNVERIRITSAASGNVSVASLTGTSNAITTLTSTGVLSRSNVYASNITTMTPTTSDASWDCSIYDTAQLNLTSTTATPGVTLTLTNLQVGSKYQLKTVQHASAAKTLTLTASGYTIKTPAGGGYAVSTALNSIDLISMSVVTANELLVVINKAFA